MIVFKPGNVLLVIPKQHPGVEILLFESVDEPSLDEMIATLNAEGRPWYLTNTIIATAPNQMVGGK